MPADRDLVVEPGARHDPRKGQRRRVPTTEHLSLAALHGCVHRRAPSSRWRGPRSRSSTAAAWPFVAHIEEVGAVEQDADRHCLTL